MRCDEAERGVIATYTRWTQRSLLATTLAVGVCPASGRTAGVGEDQPGSGGRPRKDDLLVVSEGPQSGQVIKPSDPELGAPPVHAWPNDSRTFVVRRGARLNEILIIKPDFAELDDDTRAHAADGIAAYSAICSHAGCPVTAWLKGEGRDRNVLKCACRNSGYGPRTSAEVVFGPALRRLAALPLAVSDDVLVVAAPFAGKVGTQQPG